MYKNSLLSNMKLKPCVVIQNVKNLKKNYKDKNINEHVILLRFETPCKQYIFKNINTF